MLDEITASLSLIISQTQRHAPVLGIEVAILWGAYVLTSLDNRLLYLGIIPRKVYGMLGIVFAPLLHGSFNHLFFNTIPLVILSDFILIQGLPYFLTVTIIITVLSGFLIWCFAKPGLHVGASALITGFWGLLVSDIYQQGTLVSVILGFISLYYFAGIFYGLFPGKKGVSWEGHVFGLVAGFVTSYLMT